MLGHVSVNANTHTHTRQHKRTFHANLRPGSVPPHGEWWVVSGAAMGSSPNARSLIQHLNNFKAVQALWSTSIPPNNAEEKLITVPGWKMERLAGCLFCK